MRRMKAVLEQSVALRIWGATGITIIIAAIFSLALFQSKTSDRIEPILQITPEVKKLFRPFSETIQTGLYIRNFPEFDVIENRFMLDAVVWFEFDPNVISLDDVRRFSFLNGSFQSGSEPTNNEPTIKRIGKKVLVTFDVIVEFKSDLTFYYHPLAEHILSIVLFNEHATPREMTYETDDKSFILDPEFQLSNWEITSMKTDYGYQLAQLHREDASKSAEYPLARFHIGFASLGIKTIIIFFVPMLFALLLVLFSLLIPFQFGADNTYMTGLSSTAFATLIAHRFVIETMIPKVGYMTVTDKIFMLCLLVIFIPTLFHILLTIYSRNAERKKTIDEKEAAAISTKINMINATLFIGLAAVSIMGLYLFLII